MRGRLLVFIFAFTLIFFYAASPAFALTSEVDEYDELIKSSGADRLFWLLPDETQEILTENGINGVQSEELIQLSIADVFHSILSGVMKNIKLPLTVFISCLGVILLSALLNSFKSTFSAYENVFSAVSVICVSAVVMAPIAEIILSLSKLIENISNFLLSFIPVYVGIVTASGKPLSAAAYSATLLSTVEVVSRVACTVLVPLLGIYLAFCLIGSITDRVNIAGVARSVKTIVVTALGFMLTIFTGVLAIKGIVASSADTVAMKTAKFAVSAFLPVVGSAVSEALSSVQGSVNVIRSTVGVFGIVAVAAAFLPSIILTFLMQMSLSLSFGVSDCLQTHAITRLLDAAKSALSLILGILIVFAALFIISAGLMLTLKS